jgi:predicted ATPase
MTIPLTCQRREYAEFSTDWVNPVVSDNGASAEGPSFGDEILDFSGFRLIPSARSLTHNGENIHVGGRALDILITLIQRRGEVVGKNALFNAVWPNLFVEESNLRVHMASLRKVLQDNKAQRLIANVPGRGYSFIGEVRRSVKTSGDAVPAVPAQPGHDATPAALNRLIGRDAFVDAIAGDLLLRRFISIVGAGGVGKTSVAEVVVQRLASGYRNKPRVVDLAPLGTDELVAAHIASLLRLPASDRQPLDDIVEHLKPRNELIVLDNCEHVIGAASQIAEEILKWAPEVHILATSREPLRAAGEWVHQLMPLDVPRHNDSLTKEEILSYPAVELLNERIKASDAVFEIAEADAQIAADLCRRLDGLPLAIELAATRVPFFGLRNLVQRLDDRFSLLTKGRRTAARRHQTLGAVIDWSYDTLPESEKTVWRRLAVLVSPFGTEAAAAISFDSHEGCDMVDTLNSLVEKSLLTLDLSSGDTKYRFLESPRLYALKKLEESKESHLIRGKHAQYIYNYVSSGDQYYSEAPSATWLAAHSGSIADIRAALDWAFSADGDIDLAFKLTAASAPFWFRLLLVPELEAYLGRAVEYASTVSSPDTEVTMRVYVALAHAIFHVRGYQSEVIDALRNALILAEQRNDTECQLQILWSIFGASSVEGDYSSVSWSVDRVRRVLPNSTDARSRPLYHRMAALGAHLAGDQTLALEHARKAMNDPAVAAYSRGHETFTYDQQIATSSHYMRVLWINGYADQAAAVARSTIDYAMTVNQPYALSYFLVYGACLVAFWCGDLATVRERMVLLRSVATGDAFNVFQMGARLYDKVLKIDDLPQDEQMAARQLLADDQRLTRFQAESLSTIDWRLLSPRALTDVGRGDITWASAEILRAHGETLLSRDGAGDSAEAEKLFLRSLDISSQQHAIAWELRGATSLARLWASNGKKSEARDLLSDVYGRISEGFGTRDAMEAQLLLKMLT